MSQCHKCSKANHLEAVCRTKVVETDMKPEAEHNWISLFTIGTGRDAHVTNFKQKRRFLGHLNYDKNSDQFRPYKIDRCNTMNVSIELDAKNFEQLAGKTTGLRTRTAEVEAVGDTGAAVCCAPAEFVQGLGMKQEELFGAEIKIYAADRRKLDIVGCIPVKIKLKGPNRGNVMIRQMLYFVKGINRVFISKEGLAEIGSISETFPLPQRELQLSSM